MNAAEFLAKYRQMGEQDECVLLACLADDITEFTLSDGSYVSCIVGIRSALRELSEAFRVKDRVTLEIERREIERRNGSHILRCSGRVSQPRWKEHVCPDCDHVHEGRDECKFYLREGKFCPCESKVTA